jgi:farnesyl diphosphate synthase
VRGQALDLAAEGQQVDLAALERIHRHKTGALIRAAVRMGALSAGNTGHQWLPVLDKYAESIGLAFQVQDDILDVVGDTATLGKRQADQQLGKSTYPALLGLEQARMKARDLIADARQSLDLLAAQSLDTTALEALANYIIQRDK